MKIKQTYLDKTSGCIEFDNGFAAGYEFQGIALLGQIDYHKGHWYIRILFFYLEFIYAFPRKKNKKKSPKQD